MIAYHEEPEAPADNTHWQAVTNDGEVHLLHFSTNEGWTKGIYGEKVQAYEYFAYSPAYLIN